MTADPIIRPLQPGDSIPALTQLLHRAYAPLAAQGLRYMATHQSDDVTRERVASGRCFVAVTDGVICGTILYRPADRTKGSPWYDRPDVASIGQFAVEPGLQSRGLGLRLMALAEDQCRADATPELALDTAEPATHLVSWYGRQGYRFIEHAQWGHTNYSSVIMSKTL
ncbi:GNAT family N-acetyltransferase [Devosia sp. SL43]|uniref:GNAT family N-acetyltransferase n=1 Tax=Devosia sp. SL43 TaxID=2806348 RepID=UPI001F3EFABB|nr:GNAT family N-acetyltransferase [Devosia sp. SL43]UJW84056.1 GNAT family N-acetyltransferase [Devosia sp. SL43]